MRLQDLDDVEGTPGSDTPNHGYVWDSVQAKFVLTKLITTVRNLAKSVEVTADAILFKLKTVDGSGSGLDADLLDGIDSTGFSLSTHTHSDADENTFVGEGAFDSHTTGFGNVAFGKNALTADEDGDYNAAFGWQALSVNTSGDDNIAFGRNTLNDNISGSSNVAIGAHALDKNVSGNGNVAIGDSALNFDTIGEGNVAIGQNAGNGSTADGSVYIGYSAGTGNSVDNKLVVANNQTLSLIEGVMGTTYAAQDLVINAEDVTLPGIPTASSAGVWKDGTFLRYGVGDSFNESAQDAVGGILADTTTVDLTYNDATPSITAAVINDSIDDTKLRNSGPLSVIGRSANTSGDPADISAVAASGSVLRESGSTLGFGTITSAAVSNFTEAAQDAVGGAFVDTATISLNYNDGIDEITADLIVDSVLNTHIRNSGALSVIGRSANSTGDPADISATAATDSVLRESGSVLGFGTIATGGIAADAVTNAKLANMADTTVKGRAVGAGTGDPTDLTAAQVSTIVGSVDLTMADTKFIATDIVQARDSGGLALKDDGGNVGVFIEDGGQVGINISSPAAPLHVEATSVASTAEEIARFTVSDDSTAYLKIINSTSGDAAFVPVIETLAASTSAARVDLAKITTDSGTTPGFIIDVRTAAGAAVATRPIVDYRTFGTSRMIIMGSGEVGIGDTTPDGKLDVNQSSTTAAIPTLELNQADLSEEFINFISTIGTGNPIEAVGAKTLTTTHFIRIQVDGVGYRYIPVGTIA